ncbi:hypothetical protein [Nocardia wallacei]|uniref:hypothetical protein n=1 Tax=Nocardia wallacei TaxID=480035 RepID=UPI0024550216|nr:hypothetical protein [Nocardia wallacei]
MFDEQVMAPWEPGGTMASEAKRTYRRRKGLPTWRIVRYADDLVVLVYATERDTVSIRERSGK